MNKISTAITKTGAALWLVLVVVLAGFTSCVKEEEFSDDARGNFEALWKIMDEHYCFFGEKNVDWNAVHAKYSLMVDNDMSAGQLFEVLAKMLGELKDGHVNLYSSFDVGRNWSWHENYPSNFSDTLFNKYMGTDYRIAGSLRYRVLDDNIGYVRCSSFSTSLIACSSSASRVLNSSSFSRSSFSWFLRPSRRLRSIRTFSAMSVFLLVFVLVGFLPLQLCLPFPPVGQ